MAQVTRKISPEQQKIAAAVLSVMSSLSGDDEVHVADVVRYEGNAIRFPENMELRKGIKILERKADEEEEWISVRAAIPAFPYDGAHALKLAMERLFGYVVSKRCPCGENHNTEMQIDVDAFGTKTVVPWGSFEVPGIEGHLQTSYRWEGKRVVFELVGKIRGKFKRAFDALVKATEKIAREESIYKGKAMAVSFRDEDGDVRPVPEIRFLDVTRARKPIYSATLEEQFDNDVMAYITHKDLVRPLNGGTLKRGVLMAGPYGTGKTLGATWMAKEGVEHGWTYFYVQDPAEFYEAHLLARAYQPAIVFVEDLDKIAGTERNQEVDRLLNTLDGTDTKNLDIVVVFTTNHGEKITQAMYRPGRVDFLMRVEPPDAEAAIKIAVEYAQGRIVGELVDFETAGLALSGKIPATIKEAVARAQIRAVKRTGDGLAMITNDDLTAAAVSIERERNTYQEVAQSDVQKLGLEIGRTVMNQGRHLFSTAREGLSSDSLAPALKGSLGEASNHR